MVKIWYKDIPCALLDTATERIDSEHNSGCEPDLEDLPLPSHLQKRVTTWN